MRRWLTALAAFAALVLPAVAGATAYTFPGAMPPGCSGSAGSYTCPGGSLGYGDTVAISGTKPATITVTGNLSTDTSQINQSGLASDLNLVVNGTLTLGYQAKIKANITATAVNDAGGGGVVITGNLTGTGGNISLAYQTTVSGNVSTSGTGTITTAQSGSVGGNVSGGSGTITISQSATVAGSVTGTGSISVAQAAVVSGNVSAGSGAIDIGFQAKVNGNVSSTGTITTGQSSTVGGNITGGAGNVSVGYAATVTGTITTSSGTVTFAQSAIASSCTKSTGSAAITLGAQSTVNSVCCGGSICTTSCVVNNSAAPMPPLCAGSASLLADYRMDESTAWNGTAAEVKDSSGNAYHAQAATASSGTPVATTASGSPAYGTTTSGSCGYGNFNRSAPVTAAYTYVQLPSGFPSLTSSFTVLGWVRTTAPTQSGQRIIANDDNQNGWALSLGDAGTASVRLFHRSVNPSGSVTTSGSSGSGATTAGCGALCLDSAPVFTANTWYYVVALVDVTNKQVTLQVYNAAGTLLSGAVTAYTGTWTAGTGTTSLGGESINSSEGVQSSFHFNGNIDELQVYNGLLDSTTIATQRTRSRTCPVVPAITSFTISGTGSASTCTPQTLTLTAKDSSGATLTSYTGTVNLSTSTGNGDWTVGASPAPAGTLVPGAANSGLASYTFAAGDAGVVKLKLANSLAQNVTVTVVDSAVASSASTSSAINYRDNAFVWSEDASNLVSGSFVAVAGRNHDMRVSLYKKDPSTGNCGVATDYTGSRNLKLWRTDNTSTWTAPSVVSPALSVPAARPASNNLTLSFTAGVANFNLATTNIGKYAFSLDDDSLTYAATTVSGTSTDLTVRPFTLAVTGLTASGTNNPGGSLETDTVFAKAGASFSASVTAYRWSSGADANNDGVPDSGATLAQVSAGGAAAGFNASVTLTPLAASQTPASGVLGTLANNVLSSFVSGTVTATNLSYSEVGSFALNTTGVVSSYLGTAGVNLDALVFNASGAQQTRVGRFIPAGFDVSSFVVTHRSSMACTPASTFSYMGEGMNFKFTLTAKNAAGATTLNYTGVFAKFDPTNTLSINLAGISGSAMFKAGGRMTTAFGSGTWANGVVNISMTANGQRSSTGPDGPFPTAQFGIAPVDSDGVAMRTLDLDTDYPADGVDRALLGTVPLRYGRLRLQNAMSAASRVLRLPLTPQYWDSATATFKTNDLDTCTQITAANLSFGNFRRALTSADAVMSPSTVTVNGTTPVFITLAAPSGARVGSMDIALALGSNTTDASCLSWTPSVTATAGANINAMRGAWCGSASALKDPSARATWGLYRGADGVLYQRENY